VHGELNDFVSRDRRIPCLEYGVKGHPSVKDVIESFGIPHPEVCFIYVNGESVGFDIQVEHQDKIEVFPVSQLAASGQSQCVLPFRPEQTRFLLDVHLGGLTRLLRLAGIDAKFEKDDPGDEVLARISSEDDRILLTRDINLLKRSVVRYGYWLRKTGSKNQFREIVDRYDLRPLFKPFSRCAHCNELVMPVEKSDIAERVRADTLIYFNQFWICPACEHIYWKGSHFERIKALLFY